MNMISRITSTMIMISFTLLSPKDVHAQSGRVLPGIDVLCEDGFQILKGKRVGLITNPTGVDSKLRSTIDILFNAPGMKLVALFGPEHSVRGDREGGEKVESYIDPATKIPVYSLYGKAKKPTPEMLKGIDVLVYDVQDIGSRAYTYIATMGQAMESAAESNVEFVVLDRPNPLGGLRVEGNLVERGFESFVSPYPIPFLYGLTCGELAKLINEEGMLANGEKCRLTVVPLKGWKREMTFSQTGLQWVPTSPHVPYESTVPYAIGTGILGELGVVSEGVGYTLPFRVFAAEWIDADVLATRMNALKIPGVIFRPISFKPFYGRDQGKELKGVQLHITDEAPVNLMSLQFFFLQVNHELYPDKDPFAMSSRLATFDRVIGTDKVRKLFTERMRFADIEGFLNKDIEGFRKTAAKYLLY
jgi:uncharacterized protein YbbC (DUF1343 family)